MSQTPTPPPTPANAPHGAAPTGAAAESRPYAPRRAPTQRFVPVRGIDYHLTQWGEPVAGEPIVVMVHGFMDVGASFQFVVDAMDQAGFRPCVIAPDWRGFGLTHARAHTDAYWFPDYLGDLDALLDTLSPQAPVDLLGHSMGGNVVMAYAGARAQRIRRLVNLEGFGLPDTTGQEAPGRLAEWLDELRTPQRLKPYPSLAAVADRMQRNNPRLSRDKALWLADHWAEPAPDGQWALRADPAHRRVNPVLWRASETIALFAAITAPLLWVQGRDSRTDAHWRGRYSFAEFQQRLAHVPQVEQVMLDDCGHMVHHDQPQALAQALTGFWRPPKLG